MDAVPCRVLGVDARTYNLSRYNTKTPIPGGKKVDLRGFEPLTSSVRLRGARCP
jgi:hypothetical protein